MDFQYHSFFSELVSAFNEGIEKDTLVEVPMSILGLTQKYTGFENIEIELIEFGNLAIEAGYINPNNIFNIKGIEAYLPKSESTLARWFSSNKKTFLKGDIDYSTGKVSGDYATLPFKLYINQNLPSFISGSFLSKYKSNYAEALAAAFIHEIGHAIGGVMMIHQYVLDNIIVKTAVGFYAKAKTPKERVIVIKDGMSLLDNKMVQDAGIVAEISENTDPDLLVVYLTKVAKQRNLKRSLSLGVPEMNSEVIADAYSVRMGCAKSLIVGISAITSKSHTDQLMMLFWFFAVLTCYTMIITSSLVIGLGTGMFFLSIFGISAWFGNNLPGTYNSEYRRMTDILTQMIAKLRDDKFIKPADKAEYLDQISDMIKLIEKNKSVLEGSVFQSLALWLNNGADAKRINIEHYSSLIANSKTNVLAEKLNSL